jgi:NAD(P)-dependent dehydrogenase (short-subunit alcohol dehydrogenase family)
MTVWFITGASRGFGLEITNEALSRGDSVVATARTPQAVLDALPDGGDRLLAVPLDVHRPDQITAAVDAGIEKFGRIDALVNNAGRGLIGAESGPATPTTVRT